MKGFLYRIGLAIALFLASAAVGFWQVRHPGSPLSSKLIVVASVPAAASAVFVAATTFFPLLAKGRIKWSETLSLPLVHLSLVFVIAHLVATRPASIVRQPEQLAPVMVWARPAVLLGALAAEVAALALFALRARSPQR